MTLSNRPSFLQLRDGANPSMLLKDGNTNVCTEFYDCAPSGPYGTMTYLSKAVGESFAVSVPDSVDDCAVS